MKIREYDITIQVVYENETFTLHTYQGEYRNLMMLIYDKLYIAFFGDCKGMGRCGTCLVIMDEKKFSDRVERNEAATILKTGVQDTGVRLSCQVLVDHSLHNTTVVIRD